MDKIQYFHYKNPNYFYGLPESRYTVAIEMPFKDELLDLFAFGNKEIKVNIGQSTVHPHDQYNKKVGRAVSKEKMKPTTFTFKVAQFLSDDTIHIFLYSETHELVLRVHRNSDRVYLISSLQK